MSVKPVPEGFHTIIPHIVVNDAAAAIEFYKKAFGARELVRHDGPGGKIMHARLQIGDSLLMLADEFPEFGPCQMRAPQALNGTTFTIALAVADCDALYNQAVAAGATPTMPVAEQFWGDRYGRLRDPFGHEWSLSTHVKDLTESEIEEGARKLFAQMPAGK